MFDNFIEDRKNKNVKKGDLPNYKYRARNQFRSRLPSAATLDERRKSFKDKKK